MKLLTSHGLDYEMQGASEHEFCHDKKRIGKGLVPAGIVERVLQHVAPLLQYERKGGLYVAEFKVADFARQGS